MEENKTTLTVEGLLKLLKPYMSSEETRQWKERAVDLFKDQEIVDTIYSAYKMGIGEYVGKYMDADDKAKEFEKKYYSLATKVCEKFI